MALQSLGDWLERSVFGSSPDEDSYAEYRVRGFTYKVEERDPDEDYRVAVTLHELNSIAVKIIAFIRHLIYAAERGELLPDDRDLDIGQLKTVYSRLRYKYTVDEVFESLRRHDGTSYVINNGESIHMCVRGPTKRDSFAVLLTVMVHELAHVASSTPDHDPEFWDNYELLRHIVRKMGIISLDMVPSNGGRHCQRVAVSRGEMLDMATPGVEAEGDAIEKVHRNSREAPPYRGPPRDVVHHSGIYSRISYAPGRHNVIRGPSLHSSIPRSEEYTRWTM